MHRRLDRLALKPDPVAEVESRDAISGATLYWKRTRAATELTRGVRMFFLELRQGAPALGRDHAGADHRAGPCRDLDRGSRARRGALWRAARARHGARPFAPGLGPADVLPLRRSHRRGRAPAGAGGRPDATTSCGALSWRVADIDATRARLVAAGVDVSEVRAGRKPGTRVVSVRNGTCGIQTLLVERGAEADDPAVIAGAKRDSCCAAMAEASARASRSRTSRGE